MDRQIQIELRDASSIPDMWERFEVTFESWGDLTDWSVYEIRGEDGREIEQKSLSIYDSFRINQEITESLLRMGTYEFA